MRQTVIVLCILALCSTLIAGQSAEWTIWDMPSDKSFPGDLVWMIDNSLFVTLNDPQALARFELVSGTFTWWETGGDDSPLYIVAGYPGEFWVSWEWSGKIARLRLPSE